MGSIVSWIVEQRSIVAIGAAAVLFTVTLILHYGYGLWWPWGIVMATILGIVGVFSGMRSGD